jgi:hypothetical protein
LLCPVWIVENPTKHARSTATNVIRSSYAHELDLLTNGAEA